jgi:tetratricopeptide (TPR) repeat protein
MHSVLTSQSARQRVHWRALLSIALSVVAGFACGCERPGPATDAEAGREANYQRAKKFYEQHDFQAAAEFYKRALVANPEFANAHLEMGLLCDDKLGDPISAIYHYRRYLELRPDSEKRQLVSDFIERAKLSLAAKLPQSPLVDPSDLTRLQNEKAALLQENAQLRTQIAELEKATSAVKSATAVPPTATDSVAATVSVPVTTAQPASAPPTIMAAAPITPPAETTESSRTRVHVVQKGDTLYSLALRYYGTRSAWERIYQANRSGLPSRDQLKVGQQLVIP